MYNSDRTIYEPNQRHKLGFFKVWKVIFSNIKKSKYLIWQLFKRDFLMQFKKSFLGMSWLFISPLIGIASWVFLNFAGVLDSGDTGIPYPAFVLLSTSIYGLFTGFIAASSGTLGAGEGFIMQVKYPHEVLLVKQVGQQLAGFMITFVLNVIILLLFGVQPSIGLILFPVMVLPMFLLGSSIGLILSLISVVAVDLTNLINTALGFLMYITPVIYPISAIENDNLQTLMKINPLTYLVSAVRDMTLYGYVEYPERYFLVTFFSIILFMLSWRIFYISEDRVIEKMF